MDFRFASFAGFTVTLGPAAAIITSFNELATDAVTGWHFWSDVNVDNGALVFTGIVGTLGNNTLVRAPELAAASSTLLFVDAVTWATWKNFGFEFVVPTIMLFTVFVVDESLAGSENFARRQSTWTVFWENAGSEISEDVTWRAGDFVFYTKINTVMGFTF
jgi:hypothetical protein